MKIVRVTLTVLVVAFLAVPFSRNLATTHATSTGTLATESFTKAQFEQHVKQLRLKVPSSEFSIVVQPPFVVIGDEPEHVVRGHAQNTVKWAVDKLKLNFFSKDPSVILDIWLFKDATSYQKHTRLLFNDRPSTPYGYYSRTHKALIMNIATGGGTLVHEIVHPFIEANFPACPSWLNEGLGSLYEQSEEQNGRIRGLVNWRLPGLQQAIVSGHVQSFASLTSLSSADFYQDGLGQNYAQSRYLCYYLQEKGLLINFYRRFHAQQKRDPTGYQTLVAVLGNPNMTTFQKEWEKFVLELEYR